jgi:hypothetical protein
LAGLSLIPAASPAPSDAPGCYFGDRATASATLGRATRYNKIAVEVGVSPATVSRVLRRLGLNKLNALEPAEPVRRYERENPGELIQLDIKKLGRMVRWGAASLDDRLGSGSEG